MAEAAALSATVALLVRNFAEAFSAKVSPVLFATVTVVALVVVCASLSVTPEMVVTVFEL